MIWSSLISQIFPISCQCIVLLLLCLIWSNGQLTLKKREAKPQMCPDVEHQFVRYELYDSESVFSAVQWKPWNADKGPEKVKTGRNTTSFPSLSFQSVTSFLRLRPWRFSPSRISHVSVMRMMGTGPVCEGTVSASHSVLANPQTQLAVGWMETFNSPFWAVYFLSSRTLMDERKFVSVQQGSPTGNCTS